MKIVSIICLSIAFACLVLLFAYTKFEFSFDKFHSKADRIARLTIDPKEGLPDARMYGDWRSLSKEIAGIESITIIGSIRQAAFSFDNKIFNLNRAYFVDSLFFQTFSYPIKAGGRLNPFPNQNSVVVSEGFAKRYFDSENIIGKIIKVETRETDTEKEYTITGIMHDFPSNTHFKAELLMPIPKDYNFFFYTYFLLQTPDEIKTLPAKIEVSFKRSKDDTTSYPKVRLQPIGNIHLHSNKAREMERNGSYQSLIILISAVLLILIIALINLSNSSRVLFLKNRDYYILKRTHGATIGVLILEEIVQCLILSTFIILFGFWFVFYLIKLIDVDAFSILSISQLTLISIVFIVVLVLVMVLPIIRYFIKDFFSRNRNAEDAYMPKRKSLALRGFIIAQVTISIFVIVMTIGISKQMDYVLSTQLGGKTDGIIVLPNQPEKVIKNFDKFKEELLRNPKIIAVTAAMEPPAGAILDKTIIEFEGVKHKNPIDIFCVEENFFNFFNLNVLSGTMLPRYPYSFEWEMKNINTVLLAQKGIKPPADFQPPAEFSDYFLINRSALAELDIKSPEDAIGKQVVLSSHPMLNIIPGGRIVGVVDDYKYTSMFEKERPLLILQRRLFISNFLIRYDTSYTKEALAAIREIWLKINPDYPLRYEPLPETYRNIYFNEFNSKRFLNYFSLLSLLISALGLAVMMAFFIRFRIKEIGIRKVNGANTIDIIFLLNKDLIAWVLISFCLASPLAYYVMNRWLQNFAYQTTISWWVFVGAGIIAMLVALITVSYQSIKAARMNPVDAIRYE